jgi:hypothetical protein
LDRKEINQSGHSSLATNVGSNQTKRSASMKLIERKQKIYIAIGLVGGLILTAVLLKLYYGEINYWILLITGLIGLIITILTSRYANK